MTVDDAGIARFNALCLDVVRRSLHACCASSSWVATLARGRPYADRHHLFAQAEASLRALDWAGVRQALDAHPRIGERVGGADRESAWSRQEQSGMDTASAQTRAALVEANRAYEARFGHVFLIFATGRTDTEMLSAARDRLGHDDATEQAVVRTELARIVALRLERLLDA